MSNLPGTALTLPTAAPKMMSVCKRSRILTFAVAIALIVLAVNAPGWSVQGDDGTAIFSTPETDHLRVMTWNVGDNAAFTASPTPADSDLEGRPGQFARVLRAVRPDVVCLQEVTRQAADVAAAVGTILPIPADEAWHTHAMLDNVIVSRFPLTLLAGTIFSEGTLQRGHAAALVTLPKQRYAHDLYLICAHFQSRAGAAQMALRQRQANAIVAWLDDARSAGGEITLPQGTPFLVMGDLNVIDQPSPSLNTLLSGAVTDPKTGGGDTSPHRNGLNLRDILPHHNDQPGADTYTWRDDTTSYPPGALDRILYSDGEMSVGRSFVLDTMSMSEGELRRAGLRATDVMRDPANGIHDHLPLVADLIVPHGATPSVAAPH
jgi:endonuclease/exonuclease/phosphatase family metal-dependent hydrolase